MKYLISGGNGFVGRFIKEKLVKSGNIVRTIGKSPNNNFQLDLTENSITLQENFDVIIHTASIVHDLSHVGSLNEKMILNDFEITFNFLKTIEHISYQKLIFLSSVSVYGIEEGRNIEVSQPVLPKNGYGLSKSISEKMFQQKIDYNKLLILRLPLINGPNPKGNIRKAINAIDSGKMFLFNGNKATKSVLELEDLYTFIKYESLNFTGIHQIKSYDIQFNDFVQRLSSKRITLVPKFFLNIVLISSNLFRLNKIRRTLIKITKDLTFKDSTK